jgi:translation elongation factor EF-Tu-like GTPase
MEGEADIEASIRFLSTHEGGRRGFALSGYRPQFYYDGQDHDAVQLFPDVERAYPGQTIRSLVTFLHPAFHWGKLHPGKAFRLREGHRVVAESLVTKLLNLEESARKSSEDSRRGG